MKSSRQYKKIKNGKSGGIDVITTEQFGGRPINKDAMP